MKENDREEVFANINCQDSRGEKHKIRMKVDTGANGNIIPHRIYKKMYPRGGKPTTIKREETMLWGVNGKNTVGTGTN